MRRIAPLTLIVTAAVAISGCSLVTEEPTPEEARVEQLKLPPDLTLNRDELALTIPEVAGGTASASSYDGDEPATGDTATVLPQPERVSIRRAGSDRWLEVSAPPSQVWDWLDEFLQRQGVATARRRPEAGLLVTEWLFTNRPLTGGPFAPSLEGPEQATVADRYLVRLEHGPQPESTEVFVAQRRAARDDSDRWRLQPSDPFLETEFLRSLMLYLGVETASSRSRVAQAEAMAPAARIDRGGDGAPVLTLDGAPADLWRRVGLALDRAGFTVIERDRSERSFRLRYDIRAEQEPEEAGFFDSFAFWREDAPDSVKRFRVDLTETQRGVEARVSGDDGEPAEPELAAQILGLLEEQLR